MSTFLVAVAIGNTSFTELESNGSIPVSFPTDSLQASEDASVIHHDA